MSDHRREITSLLGVAALTLLGCTSGGPFDPLDNVGGGDHPGQTRTVPELPACSATIGAPCKVLFDDLSFSEDPSCGYKGDTTLGQTWNQPSSSSAALQFGVTEQGSLQPCTDWIMRQCPLTLTNLPPLFATIAAKTIKLTFWEKHNFSLQSSITGMPPTAASVQLSAGVLNFAGSDVLTLTGSRKDSHQALELAPLTVSVTPSVSRSIGFNVVTQCGKANSLPVYWHIEQMSAELLP